MAKTATVFIRYKRKRLILNFHEYNFSWHACNCKGNIVIFINRKHNKKDRSKILHQALKKVG